MKNYSKQREKIIEVIKNSSNHLTAEEIYMIVKAQDPFVSRSTVYRNLGLLVEHNIIDKISMLTGSDRYDFRHQLHHHVICKKCGKVFDFHYDFDYDKIQKVIAEETGVEIAQKGIAMQGICNDCKK